MDAPRRDPPGGEHALALEREELLGHVRLAQQRPGSPEVLPSAGVRVLLVVVHPLLLAADCVALSPARGERRTRPVHYAVRTVHIADQYRERGQRLSSRRMVGGGCAVGGGLCCVSDGGYRALYSASRACSAAATSRTAAVTSRSRARSSRCVGPLTLTTATSSPRPPYSPTDTPDRPSSSSSTVVA